MMGPDQNPSEPRGPVPRLVRDTTLVVAFGTGLLYLCGNLYLGSYYGTLGIPERAIEWQVATALEASILPLLGIGFYTFLVLLILHGIRPENAGDHTDPAYPMPLPTLLALIFTLWAFKVFSDLLDPPAQVDWLLYPRRSVLFYVFLTLVVAGAYWWHRQLAKGRSPLRVLGVHGFNVFVLGVAFILGAWLAAIKGRWPYSDGTTAILVIASTYTVGSIFWRKNRKTAEEEASPEPGRSMTPAWRRGARIYYGLVAVLMLVVGAGSAGTVAANEALSGCTAIDTVTFSPVPEGLEANGTHWLVLHHSNEFFVRQVDSGEVGPLVVISAGVVDTAQLGWQAGAGDC